MSDVAAFVFLARMRRNEPAAWVSAVAGTIQATPNSEDAKRFLSRQEAAYAFRSFFGDEWEQVILLEPVPATEAEVLAKQVAIPPVPPDANLAPPPPPPPRLVSVPVEMLEQIAQFIDQAPRLDFGDPRIINWCAATGLYVAGLAGIPAIVPFPGQAPR